MPFELLDTKGFAFTQMGIKAARLRADFGDGYGAAARIGSAQGLRAWQIKIAVLPHTEQYKTGSWYSRAEYLWRFWNRCKFTNESEVFLFDDPFGLTGVLGNRFFARFVEDELDFDVLTKRLFSTGLRLEQVRLKGLDPNQTNFVMHVMDDENNQEI